MKCTSLSALHALFHLEAEPLTKPEKLSVWHSPRLSGEQASALEMMRKNRITLVAGSHGSGKTSTLVAAALAEVAHGKTVLISAPSTASLDQLADGIRKSSDNSVPFIRNCGGGELRLLLNRVKSMVQDKTPLENIAERDAMSQRALEKTLDALFVETNNFKVHSSTEANKKNSLNRFVKRLFNAPSHLPAINTFQTKMLKLEHQTDLAYTRFLKAFIELRGRQAIETCRNDLLDFIKSENNQDIHLNGLDLTPQVWSALFAIIPVWIIDAEAISRLVPFLEGVFDVGLIDDAHRMDSATSWPILFRVQSALLAGHQTQCSAPMRETLPTTLLDLYQHLRHQQNVKSIAFQMHYRVHDGATLKSYDQPLMASLDNSQSKSTPLLGLYWHSMMTNTDSLDALNLEAKAAVDWVKSYHSAHRHHRRPNTIGIVSPSRSQVQRLTTLAQECLPIHLFPRHALVIGLPEDFDGRDKDIMLVCLGVCAEPRLKALRYLNRPDICTSLFSRATTEQHVFSAISLETLPPAHLLRQFHTLHTSVQPPIGNDSIAKSLRDKGYEIESRDILNGLSIDYLVNTEHLRVGIMLFDHTRIMNDLGERLQHARRLRTPIFFYSHQLAEEDPELFAENFSQWLLQAQKEVDSYLMLAARSEAGQ